MCARSVSTHQHCRAPSAGLRWLTCGRSSCTPLPTTYGSRMRHGTASSFAPCMSRAVHYTRVARASVSRGVTSRTPAAAMATAQDTHQTSQQVQLHVGPPILQPASDQRSYRALTLGNGLRAVLIHDPQLTFAAACANVRCGYMLDPEQQPGLAHWLEHAVHLGSEPYPGTATYKQFLAKHGGTSNAATSMLHTRYHFKAHHEALPEALDRFAAMLAHPRLEPEDCLKELDNVHAEWSRNCNSDGRRLLQVKRSFGTAPYSSFSTGNVSSLRDGPSGAGLQPAAGLRDLWQQHYTAGNTCVAVISCHDLEQQEQFLRDSFADWHPTSQQQSGVGGHGLSTGGSAPPQDSATSPCVGGVVTAAVPLDAYLPDDMGRLVCIVPMRELRELQLMWYLPFGLNTYSSCKPWSWAAHLLGHESPGSPAHVLKAQGLVQELSAGLGEELRAGRGWSTFTITCSLTPAGEDAVPHIVATLHRAVALLRGLGEVDRQRTWQEAAQLAAVRWYWRDATEPVDAVQSAALALHHHPVHKLLSGQTLMQEYDASALQALLDCLVPSNLLLLHTSPRWRSATSSREPCYGAQNSSQPLPGPLLEAVRQYAAVDDASAGDSSDGGALTSSSIQPHLMSSASIGLPAAQTGTDSQDREASCVLSSIELQRLWPQQGELHLPAPNWALPSRLLAQLPRDVLPRSTGPAGSSSSMPLGADPGCSPVEGGAALVKEEVPRLLLEQAGLCCWHQEDTHHGVPKVQVKLHLVTQATYHTPGAAVASRLLVRVLQELLLPDTYHASLAGSSFHLQTEQTGLQLSLVGFAEVVPELLRRVLSAMTGLTLQQVQQHLPTQHARLEQHLTNWAKNNPIELAEYEAEHLLQPRHHHVHSLLAALPGVGAQQVLSIAQQLCQGSSSCSSGRASNGSGQASTAAAETGQAAAVTAAAAVPGIHVDMLVYGAAAPEQATALADQVRQQLAPGALPQQQWPALDVLPVTSRLQQQCRTQLRDKLQAQSSGRACTPPSSSESSVRDALGLHNGTDMEPIASTTSSGSSEGAQQQSAWVYSPPNPNPTNTNHAVVHLCQLGPDTVRLRVLLDLLVALAAKPAFHALRTQQRLGYLVRLKGHALPGRLLQQHAGAGGKTDSRHSSGGGQRPAAGHHGSSSCGVGEQEEEQGAGRVLGLLVGVQSPHTGCQTVQDRVWAWLESYQEHVQQLTQEEFARQLQVLQSKYREPPKCFRFAAARAWSPIHARGQQGKQAAVQFDRHERLAGAACCSNMSLEQFQAWYAYVLRAAALNVHIAGKAVDALPAGPPNTTQP